ncbi:MAG: hypothetical protein R3D65_18280 [Zhengella sp.]|uniref:hypothetical protein n=1 Tax=Zhengella sp. TaxID=2282762 RepID=UPI001D9D2E4E|nr:hypothetical protein [Notoacmeibacter sp.]MCC0028377.1 hypothetical protein [Brucellaceae bacterium]
MAKGGRQVADVEGLQTGTGNGGADRPPGMKVVLPSGKFLLLRKNRLIQPIDFAGNQRIG